MRLGIGGEGSLPSWPDLLTTLGCRVVYQVGETARFLSKKLLI
jgi:hypothetical protein